LHETLRIPSNVADIRPARTSCSREASQSRQAAEENFVKDEPMPRYFKISAEKMFWVLAAGAVAIPVLVIVWETNFGSAAGG
jgi:hypothetical protein